MLLNTLLLDYDDTTHITVNAPNFFSLFMYSLICNTLIRFFFRAVKYTRLTLDTHRQAHQAKLPTSRVPPIPALTPPGMQVMCTWSTSHTLLLAPTEAR